MKLPGRGQWLAWPSPHSMSTPAPEVSCTLTDLGAGAGGGVAGMRSVYGGCRLWRSGRITGGAEALAFDPAVLAGPDAALPHGAPGERPIVEGQVLLFDFGAQVAGYRSDMTRTLFVGEPSPRDAEIHELVARAQAAAISGLEHAVAEGTPILGRAADALAREVMLKSSFVSAVKNLGSPSRC